MIRTYSQAFVCSAAAIAAALCAGCGDADLGQEDAEDPGALDSAEEAIINGTSVTPGESGTAPLR